MLRGSPRHRGALALLAAFLLGGVVAPVLHQNEHLRREVHHHADAPTSLAAAGTGAPATMLVEELGVPGDGHCALAAIPIVRDVTETPDRTRPLRIDAFVAPASLLVASYTAARTGIRGPPGPA